MRSQKLLEIEISRLTRLIEESQKAERDYPEDVVHIVKSTYMRIRWMAQIEALRWVIMGGK